MDVTLAGEKHFEDLFVQWFPAKRGCSSAYVFFHGFPGGGVRNEDIATAVTNTTGAASFVVHYGGLGRGKGEFGFLKSLDQCLSFVNELQTRGNFETLHFYGHSWGGLVALNAAASVSQKLGDLVLVSPFSFVPGADIVRSLLLSIQKNDSGFPASLNIDSAVVDVETIAKKHNPRMLVQNLRPRRTLVLQAVNDDQVPAAMNRAFAPMFTPEARYLEVEQDHSFTNRAALIELVSKWVK